MSGAILLCVFWVYGRMHSLFRLDAELSTWFGGGFNPPGFEIMIFSLLVLLALYCIFSLLEERKTKLTDLTNKLFSEAGRNTLHIFMYHLLVRDKIMTNAPTILLNNIWTRRIIVFLPMLILPAIIAIFASKIVVNFRSLDKDTT